MTDRAGARRALVWWLALGYFLCYIPYSLMARAMSQGLLPGMRGPVAGFQLFPATAMATTVAFLVFLAFSRAWRELGRVRIAGLSFPWPRWQTVIAGGSTALIIATTTLNYTFDGVSILLALLLMRGGVIILAPLVDRLRGRRVRPQSWIAFALSVLAVAIALWRVDSYHLSITAAVNLSGYLLGYFVRLYTMTSLAKSASPVENRQYFVEELTVAAILLTLVPGLQALLGHGEISMQLRHGFTRFLVGPMGPPAAAIGLLYASLYYFGTKIYLDSRENTFCIPLNRGASLLSGIVSSYALMILFGGQPPNAYQLLATMVVIAALLVLGSYQPVGRPTAFSQRVFLFVCSGNTSRSPLAAAICTAEMAARLGLNVDELAAAGIRISSAGVSAVPGTPFSRFAQAALVQLGLSGSAHVARQVTAELVDEADAIYCMTAGQRSQLVSMFPDAESKSTTLDPNGDIDDPHEGGMDAYRRMAEQIQQLIRERVLEWAPA